MGNTFVTEVDIEGKEDEGIVLILYVPGICFALSRSGIGFAAIVLHIFYGMPGSDTGYPATRRRRRLV